MQEAKLKKDWSLTQGAFHRLLNWLKGGGSEGQEYLEMRRRLVAYFDRKNCPASNELADETLDRVSRRLEEENVVESEAPAKYCYIVARLVFLEYLRARVKDQAVHDEIRHEPRDDREDQADREMKEQMLRCLNQCADKLDSSSRKLIFEYYVGQERVKIDNRRTLAEALGITINALSIRACRIRDKLELCVRQCVGTP